MDCLAVARALAAAALLGGCASGADEWAKPGANEAAVAQVYRSCRSLAEEQVAPEIGINQDILATRGADWQRAQVQKSTNPDDGRVDARSRRGDGRVLHDRKRLPARALMAV